MSVFPNCEASLNITIRFYKALFHQDHSAHDFGAFCCHSRNTGASPFSFTWFFMCITQHRGHTALRPIRRTKQLWLSVLLKDTSAATGQARIRTHILTSPELESDALDRSAMTLHSHYTLCMVPVHVSRISVGKKNPQKRVTAPILKPTDDQKRDTFLGP